MTDPISEHLAWAARKGLRPSTVYARGCILRRFERSVGCPILAASCEALEAWWAALTITPASQGVELSNVKSFYVWAVRFDLIDVDPTRRLDAPRRHRRLPRPIGPDELERVLSTAPDRVRPWLYLAAYAGLRACEVAALRAEAVDLDARTLIVEDGKGGKQRIVPVHPRLAEVLTGSGLPAAGFLFRPVRKSGPVARSGLSHPDHVSPWLVSQLANRHLRAQKAGATFHQLRHRFGTAVYRATLDLRVTQELLGHGSPATTAGYAAHTPGAATAAVLAID